MFGSMSTEANERGRFFPGGTQVWVMHQQGIARATVLGVGTGLLGGFPVVSFAQVDPDTLAFSANLGFGIAAVSLVMLQFGFNGPVTHHMILPAGLAAVAVLSGGGAPVVAIIAAAVAGVAGALAVRGTVFAAVPDTRRHARRPAGLRNLHDDDDNYPGQGRLRSGVRVGYCGQIQGVESRVPAARTTSAGTRKTRNT